MAPPTLTRDSPLAYPRTCLGHSQSSFSVMPPVPNTPVPDIPVPNHCPGATDRRAALSDAPSPASPKLLVSVRDRNEMDMAIEAGADIVDFKEPRRGPLAPADRELWHHAASRWDRPVQSDQERMPWLSAALGECEEANSIAHAVPFAFDFAKVGPSGCRNASRVIDLWAEIRCQLDDSIELVAVAYADWGVAGCPDPETLFDLASSQGFRRILIDTFQKDGRSTEDHIGTKGLVRLSRLACRHRLWWTLAGSVTASCVSKLAGHGVSPDCYGVRGDVCRNGRGGELCSDRIAEWKTVLAKMPGPSAKRR